MRITSFTTPLGADISGDILVFREASGFEGMNQLFDYDITMHSATAGILPKTMLGKSITLSILDQFDNPQYLNGIVFEFKSLGADYRRTLYQAKIVPWLALTKLSSDARIFQNMNVVDIVMQVLGKYPFPVKQKLMDSYPSLVHTTQYNESDFAFVSRLLERFGIGYYFEHTADGHTLVLTDRMSVFTPVAGHASIMYRPMDNADIGGEESIHRWHPQQSMKPGSYATDDYDYRQPNASFGSDSTGTMDPKQHDYDKLPVYHWLGQGHFNDWDLGERIATLNQDEQQGQYQAIEAESDVRALIVGASGNLFTLTDHLDAPMNREYLIVATHSFIRENSGTTGDVETQTEWGTTLTLSPSNNQYRPPQRTPLPKIQGPQTAIVDGPGGSEIWTNDLAEIKLRFLWDRYAPGQGNSSRWVREVSPWAGDGWGANHIARIGTEVIVMFLDGNPDNPVVIGRVPNTSMIPPTFSNTGKLPGNQALAGIKSKELGGDRYNQMLMDDTTGQIRMQLESEHAKTQLNMGYLVHPRDVSGVERGEGFELRTDNWGALRAGKGLFITTDGRYAAVGNALSRDELIICLQEALSLAKNLGTSATQHEGNVSDLVPQEKLSKAVNDWGHGSNAEKGGNGGNPIVAISSPAGIALGTPQNTTIATGEHIDTVAQKNQHITAGEKMNLHAQKGISQFADSGGIKSIAHQGKNVFHAHSDNIQIAADKNVKITASHDHVMIAADQYVALTSGGAYIKLAGGNIDIHCPGTVSIKGGNHTLSGATSMTAELPTFRDNRINDESFVIKDKATGELMIGKLYRIKRQDGSYEEGITDENGRTHLVTTLGVETVEIQVQG